MSGLVYYRNRLAHQYAGLDSNDLKEVCSKIDTIHEYIEVLKRTVTAADNPLSR